MAMQSIEERNSKIQYTSTEEQKITMQTTCVQKERKISESSRSQQSDQAILPPRKQAKLSLQYLKYFSTTVKKKRTPSVRPCISQPNGYIDRTVKMGHYGTAIRSILKKGERAKRDLRDILKKIIKTEMKSFLKNATFPEFNDSSSIEDIDWTDITKDMQTTMPTIMTVMHAIMPQKSHPDRKGTVLARIGFMLSIALYSAKPASFKFIQSIISDEMWIGGSSEKLFRCLNYLGVCQSRARTRKRVGSEICNLEENPSEEVVDWSSVIDENARVSITIVTDDHNLATCTHSPRQSCSVDKYSDEESTVHIKQEVDDVEEEDMQMYSWTMPEENLLNVQKKASQRPPLICPDCLQEFTNKTDWRKHRISQHDFRAFQCTECAKRFTRATHLKVHMNTHTGLKPFECNVCGRSFADPSSRRKHQKLCSFTGGGKQNSAT